MSFVMRSFGIVLAALASVMFASAEATSPPKMNVLHLISDDLCARLGCYGDPMVKTPNLDALAARGVRFDRAYCQYPLCNPSRASFMTGRRPDNTRVYENQTNFRNVIPDVLTIPQCFQKAGYSAARVGKIYHYGVPREIGTSGMDDPASWEEFINPRGRDVDDIGMVNLLTRGDDGRPTTRKAKNLNEAGGTLSWLADDGTDAEQTDGKGAAAAVAMLEKYAAAGKPFYLAVGFFRPHTPYVAPKAYYDMYPKEKIALPVVPPNLEALFPAQALASRKPEQEGMSDDLRRTAIQAYSAATTFMDAQVGVVLAALERLHLAESTVVVFHGDHGYHLGEKDLWQKMSLFEESARVPLIIAVPRNAANGTACARPVELVSLHKTLTELCGVEEGSASDGPSLRPLVENPTAEWQHAAYTQVNRTKNRLPIMGRTVRTDQYRYTEWDGGKAGVELYDHATDPYEMKNLAEDPAHKDLRATLQAELRKGM